MGGSIVKLKDIQFDEPQSNLPAFDIALPAGADAEVEARKIIKNGTVPLSSVKFDQPEKKQKGRLPDIGVAPTPEAIASWGEAGLALGTGAVSWIPEGIIKFAGAVSGQTKEGAAMGEALSHAMTYEPRTAGGKALVEPVGQFFENYGIAADEYKRKLEAAGYPKTAIAANTLVKGTPFIVPEAVRGVGAIRSNVRSLERMGTGLEAERTPTVPVERFRGPKPTEEAKTVPLESIAFDEQPKAVPISEVVFDREAPKPAPAQEIKPVEATIPERTVEAPRAAKGPREELGIKLRGEYKDGELSVEAIDKNGKVVGNAAAGEYWPGVFVPDSVGVDAPFRRKGLASAMYDALKEYAPEGSRIDFRNADIFTDEGALFKKAYDKKRGYSGDVLTHEMTAGEYVPSERDIVHAGKGKTAPEAPRPPEIVKPGATSGGASPLNAIRADALKKAIAEREGEMPKASEPLTEAETGIKNAVTEAERAAKGLDEVEVEARRSFGTTFDEGKRLVDSGEKDPRALARELADNPRALNAEESATLIYDRMRLQNEHRATMDAIEKALKDGNTVAETEARRKLSILEEEINTNDVAARRTGYEQGLGLAARRMMIKQDYSLSAMLQRARIDNGGKPVTPEVRAKYEALARQIEEANAKIAAHEAKIAELEASRGLEKIRADAARERRQAKRAETKQELAAEFTSLVKELNESLGGLHSGVDPTAALVLGKMAKNRVKSGVVTVEGIIDHIYTELKKAGIDLSKRDIRDAISGYGVTAHMSKEAVAKQLRELKRQMRLISALEDAKAGKAPLRSGLQRDVASDAVRALERQVHQAMRDSGVKIKTPEEQWKTSLDAVKTRLKHQIADLVKRMETGEAEAKKTGIKYDAEAEALRTLRNKVQAVLDFAEGKTGKRELSPEQRVRMATEAVKRSISEYERRIVEEDLKPKKKAGTTPETPELKALRNERDLLKDIYKTLQDEAKPKKSPEEIALKAYKTRTANRITELEAKVKAGDFSKKPKREIAMDQEALNLQFKLDTAKRAYHEARMKDNLARRNWLQKAGGAAMEAINLSRAIKTSFDLSAVLRQGGFIALGHPLRAAKSIPAMFKALTKKGEFAVNQEILNRPNYRLYEQSKLYLAEHGQKLSQMEEAYMSRWAEKVPGVAASQRAYTTFLNKLRADSFDAMIEGLAKDGRKPTPEEAKAVANYINVATGRGNLGAKENALVGLNTVFFAPRYVASRFQLLAGQPLYRGSAATRKMVAKEYGRFLAGIGTVYALGIAAGGSVETDPRSADFGKIRFGNTRLDPLAGLAQVTVLVARLATGETKTASGKIVPIRGDNVPYGGSNSADVIARFMRSKLSPVVGTSIDVLAGKDVVGQKVMPETMPERLLIPLAFNDIYTAMKEEGVPAGSAFGILAIFGMGLQNYDPKRKSPDTATETIRQDIFGLPPTESGRGRSSRTRDLKRRLDRAVEGR